jgi:8-oxo-dGTP diphosphatase
MPRAIIPPRPMLAASVGVFREGRVLIGERLVEPAKGLFTFPGGRVEMGESLADAALRELHEEVGVTAAIAGFVDHVETIIRDASGMVTFHAIIVVFAARWLAGEPQSSAEIGQTHWVRPEDVARWPTTRGLPGIVLKARSVVEEGACAAS